MARNRTHTLALLAVVGVGLLMAAIAGLVVFMTATARPLHPDPQGVPSHTGTAPPPVWADAAERGRQVARAQLIDQNLPGLSVAVGVGGDLVWAEAFGWANLEERIPVAPDTPFRIGTASMALTSAAIGLLLEQQRLRLDDEIQRYVPAFPRKQWPVTVRQLMGHLAGVRTDAGDEEPVWSPCAHTIDGLERFADRSLLFEPGTGYRFSTYGWILLSAAVEAAAAEPFQTFMRQRIFAPLGMGDTRDDTRVRSAEDHATFYFPRFAADPRYGPQAPDEVDYSCFSGASGLLSTPSDLVRFAMAIDAGALLQPATVELLHTPQRLPSGEDTGYGLGWDLETVELNGAQTRVIGHDGELRGGMVASLVMFRDRGLVVAVTANTAFADTFSIGLAIAEAFAAR